MADRELEELTMHESKIITLEGERLKQATPFRGPTVLLLDYVTDDRERAIARSVRDIHETIDYSDADAYILGSGRLVGELYIRPVQFYKTNRD